jgi:hypothetical protein
MSRVTLEAPKKKTNISSNKEIRKTTNVKTTNGKTTNRRLRNTEQIKSDINSIEELTLWETQKECVENSIDILKDFPCVLNTSPMGCGKTEMSLMISKLLGLEVIVICPASLRNHWKEKCYKYNVPLLYNISYSTLIIGKNDIITKRIKSYAITDYFVEICKKGILIIFDEISMIRNAKTSSLSACHAIVKHIRKMHSSTRCILLSATPGNEKSHIPSLFKVLGLTGYDSFHSYDRSSLRYKLLGMDDVLSYCYKIDKNLTQQNICNYSYNQKNLSDICYFLYCNIIRDRLVVSSQIPHTPFECCYFNGYFKMDKKDSLQLSSLVRDLHKIVSQETSDQETSEDEQVMPIQNIINHKQKKFNNLDIINSILKNISNVKVNTLARLVKERLTTNPFCKVIVFIEYRESIFMLNSILQEYSPRIINGSTKQSDRKKYIDIFQKPTLESRILIIHPKVGGFGLSLDDIYGNYPRFSFFIPSYHFIDLIQLTGRTNRGTTKSKSYVVGVYGEDSYNETSLLNSIIRKTNITKEIVSNPEQIYLPGDFESRFESEGNIFS